MAVTPVVLPGESPWTGQPAGLQPMGSQRVRHDCATKHSVCQAFLKLVICLQNQASFSDSNEEAGFCLLSPDFLN